MEKKIILLPLLLLIQFVSAQDVKFTDGYYTNGLSYPIATFRANTQTQENLNNHILKICSEYESQDYCIGQYGFVQQTIYIQLHFYFNCIDMPESKNEYHLFDLSTGDPCLPSAMFLEKQMKKFKSFFRTKIAEQYTANGRSAPEIEVLDALTIDDFMVQLSDVGIEVRSDSLIGWDDMLLKISWIEIRQYLKTTFI